MSVLIENPVRLLVTKEESNIRTNFPSWRERPALIFN